VSIGDRMAQLSLWSVRFSAMPALQPMTLIASILWLEIGLRVDLLTNILSIWAIILSLMLLTKMVLDDEQGCRRDMAIQAKLDELIKATAGARDDLRHLEDRPLVEIEERRD
jgi:low affinity Fe/Cu permease